MLWLTKRAHTTHTHTGHHTCSIFTYLIICFRWWYMACCVCACSRRVIYRIYAQNVPVVMANMNIEQLPHTHTTIDSAILYCCHQITFVHTINISHPSNIRARVFAKYVLYANAAHVFWGIFCVLFLRCHHHACLKGYGSFDLPPCKLNIF